MQDTPYQELPPIPPPLGRQSSSLHAIGSFTEHYRKLDNNAVRSDGTGFLQDGCTVCVHDIGASADVGRYEVNDTERKCVSIADLQSALPKGLLHESKPSWVRLRWIDVEGMNGEIVQYILELIECDRQYTFNNIVNLKQRVMGLLLSDEDSDETENDDTNTPSRADVKFLMVTKVPSLTPAAQSQQQRDSDSLYSVEDKIIDFEQISYCLKIDSKGEGILISFQEGKAGDVFSEVRDQLRREATSRKLTVAYLFMQLVRASTESAASIERYIEDALDQLEYKMKRYPDSEQLEDCARSIYNECESLSRTMIPFAETLLNLTAGFFPARIMGKSKAAWMSLAVQQKRLGDNVKGEQMRANELITTRENDRQKRIEKSSFLMGVMLSVFSPLAFISGIYGMNFQKSDGTPGLPELRWGWEPSDPSDPNSLPISNGAITGYGYFWILCCTTVVAILLIYIYMGLIPVSVVNLFKKFAGKTNKCLHIGSNKAAGGPRKTMRGRKSTVREED